MAWLSFLIALLKAVSGLTDYLQQRKLIEATQAEIIKKNMENAVSAIEKAKSARKAAIDKFNAADGVPDESDPNLRD